MPIKGSRPGAKYSEATEAGKYPDEFSEGLVQALTETLGVEKGGRARNRGQTTDAEEAAPAM